MLLAPLGRHVVLRPVRVWLHLLIRVLCSPFICRVFYQMGNNNSSRYGVVTQLQFDDGDIPKMVGSLNRTYLLEKSRVVSRSSRERNFHVFYQMVGSDDEEFKKSLQLSGKMRYCLDDMQGTPVSHVLYGIVSSTFCPRRYNIFHYSLFSTYCTCELMAGASSQSVEKTGNCADGGCSFHSVYHNAATQGLLAMLSCHCICPTFDVWIPVY